MRDIKPSIRIAVGLGSLNEVVQVFEEAAFPRNAVLVAGPNTFKIACSYVADKPTSAGYNINVKNNRGRSNCGECQFIV
mgnify:CR=1 FL=1